MDIHTAQTAQTEGIHNRYLQNPKSMHLREPGLLDETISTIMRLERWLPYINGRAIIHPHIYILWWRLYCITHKLLDPKTNLIHADKTIQTIFTDDFVASGMDPDQPFPFPLIHQKLMSRHLDPVTPSKLNLDIVNSLFNTEDMLNLALKDIS